MKKPFILITTILWLMLAEVLAQTIRYVNVNATGANNGTSWTNAYTNLQPAINAAQSGDQVWVAKGTYKPTLNAAGGVATAFPRTRTFLMKAGVKIYGGFVGNELSNYDLSLRNFITNTTTLSGDLNGNDTPNFGNNSDNTYHVVTGAGSSSAVLDGFTITAGNANDANFNQNQGGGMFNSSCSPTISNCLFLGNSSSAEGGGMYNSLASPLISRCTFSGNRATFLSSIGEGGGIFTFGTTSIPDLRNCTFTGNSAGKNGGALSFSTTGSFPPLLTNCSFSENTAGNFGGGIYCYASSLLLTDCSFSKNNATSYGGGMYNTGNLANTTGSSSQLINCLFSENKGSSGGGMHNATANCSPKLFNCSFIANDAVNSTTILDEGGGMYTYGGNPELTNCVFSGNRSKSHGGGMSTPIMPHRN